MLGLERNSFVTSWSALMQVCSHSWIDTANSLINSNDTHTQGNNSNNSYVNNLSTKNNKCNNE